MGTTITIGITIIVINLINIILSLLGIIGDLEYFVGGVIGGFLFIIINLMVDKLLYQKKE